MSRDLARLHISQDAEGPMIGSHECSRYPDRGSFPRLSTAESIHLDTRIAGGGFEAVVTS
jgi:hypothetical protein